MLRKAVVVAFTLAGVFGAVNLADAAKPKKKQVKLTKEEKAFRERLGKLKKEHPSSIINIRLAVDDASKIPGSASADALTLVAGKRQIEVPSTLSPDDIGEVINDHLADVKKCYKKQLEEDPEWNDELILDLAIKKTGRVSEVSVAPRRVKRDPIGVCLMSTVPKWKFPQFTGESEDGVTQEVVTASFPFTLEQPQ
jgi:hypothetical protein